jgi:hypothetical protein
LQDPPKFTQLWIFGLKTNHLATLLGRTGSDQKIGLSGIAAIHPLLLHSI